LLVTNRRKNGDAENTVTLYTELAAHRTVTSSV